MSVDVSHETMFAVNKRNYRDKALVPCFPWAWGVTDSEGAASSTSSAIYFIPTMTLFSPGTCMTVKSACRRLKLTDALDSKSLLTRTNMRHGMTPPLST